MTRALAIGEPYGRGRADLPPPRAEAVARGPGEAGGRVAELDEEHDEPLHRARRPSRAVSVATTSMGAAFVADAARRAPWYAASRATSTVAARRRGRRRAGARAPAA